MLSAFWRGIIVLVGAVTCLGYIASQDRVELEVRSSLH